MVIVAADKIAITKVQSIILTMLVSKIPKKNRIRIAKPAAFGATDKNAVIVVGEPS